MTNATTSETTVKSATTGNLRPYPTVRSNEPNDRLAARNAALRTILLARWRQLFAPEPAGVVRECREPHRCPDTVRVLEYGPEWTVTTTYDDLAAIAGPEQEEEAR